MKMDEEDHKLRQALRKNNKKSEKALSQADFPKNPVISFSVLRDKTDTAVDTIVSTAVSLFYREKHRQDKHL